MTVDYQLTETAEDDLGAILLYVAEQDGVDRALRVHTRFLEAFEHLSAMPGSGSKRVHLTGVRVRWWTVFRWVVIYDPETSPILIMRVIHAARDLNRILIPDRRDS